MKTLFAAAALTGAALAQDPGVTFIALDVDEDGKLSLEEILAVAPDVTKEDFATYDANGDGYLQQPEFETWLAAQGGSDHADPQDEDGDDPSEG